MEKMFEISNKQSAPKSAQKHKKGHKKFFNFRDTNDKNSILLFHFFVIWLWVKYKDFIIISNPSQIIYVFILLYKDRLKVQHESATCPLCTNMLYSYVTLFLGRF